MTRRTLLRPLLAATRAALIFAGRGSSATPDAGTLKELDAIAACRGTDAAGDHLAEHGALARPGPAHVCGNERRDRSGALAGFAATGLAAAIAVAAV